MYCSKCGKEIPDDSMFCSECGQRVEDNNQNINRDNAQNNSTNQDNHYEHNPYAYSEYANSNNAYQKGHSNFDPSKIGKFFIESVKHPITTIKSGKDIISKEISALYIIVIAFLIPLIQVLSLRSFAYSIFKTIMNLVNSFEGSQMGFGEAMRFKSQFSSIFDMYFPFVRVYVFNLLHYVALYGIILIAIFIIYKFVIKSQFSVSEFLKVFAVVSIFNLLFTILSAVLLLIGVTFSLFATAFMSAMVIALLFVGYNSLFKEKNRFIYIFGFIYGISFVITNYLCIEYVMSSINNYIGALF
ncbi:zinc-ribbon domain-containing protein [Clostridium baratii]|uniref:zinc ribbon domain-containing protein n=1 Tax=Clostridium baratii TaxID=1561 RepID=UPI002A7627F9|nr:zinc-ribbon domain-containing protein [Clostridium baratii]MDY3206829.1 zinc-ribbon domain-containing protein [Clostridium baratii]